MSNGVTQHTLSHEARRRRNGVFVIFAISGLALSAWLARLPAIRDNLDISPSQVGILLFGAATGAIVGLGLSAHIVAHLGARRTILISATCAVVAVGAMGIMSVYLPTLWIVVVSFVLFGMGSSITDVAMNVEGAEVEREIGRAIMPWFHAFFSIGTVVGGAIASLASAWSIGVEWHLVLMSLALVPVTLWGVKLLGGFGRSSTHSRAETPKTSLSERMAVWKEPRTLLIGVVALSMAFAEGSANDWLALGMVDDRGYDNTTAALWFVAFTGAMTLGRIVGVGLIDRFGRVLTLQLSALSALLGLAGVILVDSVVVSVIGVVLWGLGSALGFPVAMSAAADDPVKGAARVSAVATVAYAAFLVGPPLIGGLAESIGILNSLWVVAALVALGFLATPSTKPQIHEAH